MIPTLLRSVKTLHTLYKKYKRQLSILFGLLFLGIIVYYVFKNIHEFSTLRITNVFLLLVIFIFVLVRNFSTGLVMDSVLRPLNVHLTITESFGLANLTRLVNQLLPGNVGIVMRSMYLKRRHSLSYASFTSSFAASQIILYLLSSILGIVGFIIASNEHKGLNIVFLYLLIGMTLGLLGLLFIPRRWSNRIQHNRIRKAIEGWYEIRTNTKCLIRLSVWSLLFITASTAIMYANFNSLGASISISMALFFSSINVVNTFVSFTPAGFGVSEGIIVLTCKQCRYPYIGRACRCASSAGYHLLCSHFGSSLLFTENYSIRHLSISSQSDSRSLLRKLSKGAYQVFRAEQFERISLGRVFCLHVQYQPASPDFRTPI